VGSVLGCHPGKHHVGQAIAADIGVDVIGHTIGVPDGSNHRVPAFSVIAEQENGNRGDRPRRIGRVGVAFNGRRVVATHLGDGDHARTDALLEAKVSDDVRPIDENGVVGANDEVFKIRRLALRHYLTVINLRQRLPVEEGVREDGIPPAAAQPVLTEVAVAAREGDLDLYVFIHDQHLRDRVVLERRDAQHHHVHPPDLAGLRKQNRLVRIISVLAVYGHVFLVRQWTLIGHKGYPEGGRKVHVMESLCLSLK